MTIIAQLIDAAAAYDYDWLQTAVADWMHKSNLTGRIPDFIMLAEARIKADMQARFQVSSGTITAVAGLQYATWPSALLRAKSVSIPGTTPHLDYVTIDQLNDRYNPETTGAPQIYTLVGDLIYFGPTPDSAYTVAYTAQASVAPLSDTSTTNALLSKWPNVYLWASLIEAALFSRDFALREQFAGSYAQAMDAVNIVEWHSGGPMRQRSDVWPV